MSWHMLPPTADDRDDELEEDPDYEYESRRDAWAAYDLEAS